MLFLVQKNHRIIQVVKYLKSSSPTFNQVLESNT